MKIDKRVIKKLSKIRCDPECLLEASWVGFWSDVASKMGSKWSQIGTKIGKMKYRDDVKKVMDDTTPNAIEGTILNELHAVKAFNSIQSNSKREWILWARLAFFPHLIDGQIMKSSTLANSKKLKNVNQALIFHTLKEAFEQDFVE